MRNRSTALLPVAWFVACVVAQTTTQAQQVPWAAERQAAILRLECQCTDGSKSIGTGTFLGGRFVCTAEHVLRGSSTGVVSDMSGNVVASVAKIVTRDSRDDVALIELDRELPMPAAPIAEGAVIGEEVFLAGWAQGRNFRTHKGVITSQAGDGSLWVNSGSISGESGGPVFNSRGELLGPISASDHTTETVFASPRVTAAVCAVAQQVRYTPPPQQQCQPSAPVTVDSAKIAEALAGNDGFVTKLVERMAAHECFRGPRGPEGQRGPAGEPGKFTDQQIASIVAMAAELAKKDMPEINPEAIASAAASQALRSMKPIEVETYDRNGKLMDRESYPYPGPIKLRYGARE